MAQIDALLEEVLKRKGSDLHLIAGDPPRCRRYGDLTALRDPDVILVQLHCTDRPPEGVDEETLEGALLQSNQ